ncbi:GNAT family N-acetyltransferase [Streptomyces mirabilis]|uniref:GNAT family N-acetyltransferase n=1 Tax=Streptomyces mirabilis TaxID=68239 RepID=UPI0022538788|nr:GNAT family N-acetyltransferase [Streptomyces mirabilis]MCX4430382.1 GNAT family N-acetyltransferase [Streptomyces mirabilis]
MDRLYEHTTKRCTSSQIDALLRAEGAALAETRRLGDTDTGATLSLSPLRFSPDEMREVVDLYESNPEYCRAAGEYDPEYIESDRVQADLQEEAGSEGCEVLIARDGQGRLVGLLCLLDQHPADGHPWIGLLLVHGSLHRQGVGRRLTCLVEDRFRNDGRDGIRLAVLENTPTSLAFWSSLGWHECDRRADNQRGRPCIVMHKQLV